MCEKIKLLGDTENNPFLFLFVLVLLSLKCPFLRFCLFVWAGMTCLVLFPTPRASGWSGVRAHRKALEYSPVPHGRGWTGRGCEVKMHPCCLSPVSARFDRFTQLCPQFSLFSRYTYCNAQKTQGGTSDLECVLLRNDRLFTEQFDQWENYTLESQ